MKMKKIHKQIVETLKEDSPLTLDEISQKLDMPKKKVFKALRKLFQEEIIKTENVRSYKLSEETEASK
ncbi:MAG: Lrp/AsnC family transcriptional regulator [Candidatus Bathyarchaeota archaeon]|jgi:DNA-binding Lrp family transcriptional regulator